METKTGWLYVLYGRNSEIKIGVTTREVKLRLDELNRGTRMPVKIKLLRKVKTPYFQEAEKKLHRIYQHQRIDNTEWFNLAPNELVALALMNKDHLEELVLGERNYQSLEEIVFGAQGIILNAEIDYVTRVEELNITKIRKLRDEVKRLKQEIRSYQEALGRKARNEMREGVVENSIRSVLSMIPKPKEVKND